MQKISSKDKNVLLSAFLFFFFAFLHISNAQVGIGTITPNSTFEENGSVGQKVNTITAAATLDETHNTIICNNGATAITVTLPTAIGVSGRIYTILRIETSTGYVTIATTSSQTINESTSLVLKNTNESVMLISNDSNWKTTSSHNNSDSNTDYLLFPMGEISYFNTKGGATITIGAQSNGTTNMVLSNPATALTAGSMDFDNGGANTGRLRYIGTITKVFHVACTISASGSASNDQFVFGVAKNGTEIFPSKVIQKLGSTLDTQSAALHFMISIATNEYLELYAGNMSSTANVKINSICLFALGMSM